MCIFGRPRRSWSAGVRRSPSSRSPLMQHSDPTTPPPADAPAPTGAPIGDVPPMGDVPPATDALAAPPVADAPAEQGAPPATPPPPRAKTKGVADIVFLIDVSGSMAPIIDALRRNIEMFIDSLSHGDANNAAPVKDWRGKVMGYRDIEHAQAEGLPWIEDRPFRR